jgi:hypothetical protein
LEPGWWRNIVILEWFLRGGRCSWSELVVWFMNCILWW